MKYNQIKILSVNTLFILISFCFQCAAIPSAVQTKERNLTTYSQNSFKLVFTGFYRYEKEKDLIHNKLVEKGYKIDQNSTFQLEIILQKKEPKYNSEFFHKLHFLLTFFSGGIIPTHIRTEHTVTFRYSKSDDILQEKVYFVGMDQFRGIPIFVFMITHWPNQIFKDQLLETINMEFIPQ
ncbi:hypothetical protein LEP1GSC202_1730 [Leptospira yanagawae serovar Saopaulo str. Sao Paulo = ATCC 700523]|uniref:Lipoprotein n=2 Tax=Leptospira yanagawae TaxID=293069 RepID=A0ABY2M2Y1_9LEPT|nr:hypothetical protein [Leptospira yanagawae]EOQ89858.1 hypothetical protein LEP1GSC202_1730 [Leptospira yanagawae serovar Saopaulo str. Sao Paulo = ATCC 700523]TGL22298.1 hypothetical protein EHQ46_06165 [Leptospira yanagawae]